MNKFGKTKKLSLIYFLFWLMLAYVVAALIWWFIELYHQNEIMTTLRKDALSFPYDTLSNAEDQIEQARKRKVFQYLGEGITFLLLIVTMAVFFFRTIRKQLLSSQQQQSFMMAVTHELKTPIAVSSLNLETMQKRKLEEQQQEKLIRNTLDELVRMNSLCNNMLLSSQFDAGKFALHQEMINLKDLTENTVNHFRNRYPAGKIHFEGTDVNIKGDHNLLEILINNLIDNAIKYSPKQETITVRVENETGKSMACLYVEDKGSGIPAEETERIFERFYRLGNEATRGSKGTGLGLYLVKRICMAHEGRISVIPNQPCGTIFKVMLPSIT